MIEELRHDAPVPTTACDITPEAIRRALHAAGGNRGVAAKKLGVSYKVLLHRLRQFGMEPETATSWQS